MTMPHLMNCEHQGGGWCLDCVKKLQHEKEQQCQMLWELRVDLDVARRENTKLRKAVRAAGFAVMQTSGDWSIHDVSEKAEHRCVEEDRIINENINLIREVKRLTKLVEKMEQVQ
jgi:hypothetical protein